VFTNKAPSREEFQKKFEDIDAFGLYLHIPFCEQICPYCPNDRGIYRDDTSVLWISPVSRQAFDPLSRLRNREMWCKAFHGIS
jgi:hypothetical protein